ncbi:MAG: DciA family protein [Alphaproteobacteria bacterium]|nr:DciA family protein [Alphaproteobacteria bacterium]
MPPENPTKRRYSLFSKTLKSCVEPVVRPVLKANGLAASKLISEWEQLVGKDMAAHTLPVKLAFAKDKNSEGTLTIACSGVHALTLQHMQPVIIERIASYFGYRAVARIAIEQRPMSAPPAPVIRKIPAAKNVDSTCITEVEDEELRNALSGLAKTFASPTLDN